MIEKLFIVSVIKKVIIFGMNVIPKRYEMMQVKFSILLPLDVILLNENITRNLSLDRKSFL